MSDPAPEDRLRDEIARECDLRAFFHVFTKNHQNITRVHVRNVMLRRLCADAADLGIEPESITMDVARALLAIIEQEKPWL